MYFIIIAIVVVILIYRRRMRSKVDLISEPLFLKNKDNELDAFIGYPKVWYMIMSSDELKTNEAKAISMCEKEMVLFRGPSGKIYALSAYCCHLGANIGIGGRVTQKEDKDCIMCPFHGWEFNGANGKCVKIPNLESNEIPTNARIGTYPVTEQEGMIYIWYDSEGGEPTFKMEMHQDSFQTKFDTTRPYFNPDWIFYNDFKLAAENSFDPEHIPFVHDTILGMRALLLSKTFTDGDHHCIDHTVLFSLFGIELVRVYLYIRHATPTVVPAMFTVTIPFMNQKILTLSETLPLSPMKGQFKFYLFFENDSMFTRIVAPFIFKMFHEIWYQDKLIWWNMKMLKQPVMTKNDKTLVDYRNWCKKFF